MKKGLFYFPESGRYSIFLSIVSAVSILLAIIIFFATHVDGITVISVFLRNGFRIFSPHAFVHWGPIWSAFFFLLGIITIFINVAIHKVCRDIASLLKDAGEDLRYK